MSDEQKTSHHFAPGFNFFASLISPTIFLLTFSEAEGLTQEGSLSVCSISEADWEGGSRQTPRQNREEIGYVGIA